jgi:hypothetical protein
MRYPTGSQDCVTDALQLQQHGITHVLNLVPDLQPHYPELFQYLTVPVLDVEETDLLAVCRSVWSGSALGVQQVGSWCTAMPACPVQRV